MVAKRYTPEQEKQIVELYIDGAPMADIKRRFGGSSEAIRSCVQRHGAPMRAQRRPHRAFLDGEIETMARMWGEGLSQSQIAVRMDTTQIVVSRALNAAGIKPAPRKAIAARGERHGSWKGGRVIADGGYVLVKVDSDDQYAAMRNRQGYVLEHRLVVAKALGRPLRRDEHVHHINGIKDDNRLDNLQLMNGPHPKGAIFMCADCGSTNLIPKPLTED